MRCGIFYEMWNILWDVEYFMTICYILSSLGTFLRFWYHVPRKIWQPWFAGRGSVL
jgi:hypothetical protein